MNLLSFYNEQNFKTAFRYDNKENKRFNYNRPLQRFCCSGLINIL